MWRCDDTEVAVEERLSGPYESGLGVLEGGTLNWNSCCPGVGLIDCPGDLGANETGLFGMDVSPLLIGEGEDRPAFW